MILLLAFTCRYLSTDSILLQLDLAFFCRILHVVCFLHLWSWLQCLHCTVLVLGERLTALYMTYSWTTTLVCSKVSTSAHALVSPTYRRAEPVALRGDGTATALPQSCLVGTIINRTIRQWKNAGWWRLAGGNQQRAMSCARTSACGMHRHVSSHLVCE